MKVEYPLAYRFLLQDDIYLLSNERQQYVVTDTPPVPEEPIEIVKPIEFAYMGGAKKNFLIITHYTDHQHIDPIHFAALENILKRKELILDDVAIFNIKGSNNADLDNIITYFKPQKMLLLGALAIPNNLTGLSINQPGNANGAAILYTFSFDEMMDNTGHKKIFWEQMKRL